MLVTKNCKNPELAFQLGDLMSSEYLSIVTRWGQEGIDWDYISNMSNPSDYDGMYEAVGFEKYIVCYDDAAFWSAGTPQNRAYRQQGPYVRQYAIANGQAKKKGTLSEDVLRLAQLQYDLQNGGYNPTEVIPKLIYNSEESDQISEISTNLLTYVHEYCAAVIDGQMVLDDSWEDFKQEIQMIGLDTYLDVTQKVYDRMYK
jgi:putative aldouronate transport system substrate-binding protein